MKDIEASILSRLKNQAKETGLRVQYLQEILAEAKIPYEVNKSVKIKINKTCDDDVSDGRKFVKNLSSSPSSNSRRLLEAIPLVLFKIKSYLTGEEFNLSSFQSTDNERIVNALLMTFDPFTHEEIKGMFEQEKIIALTDIN